MAFEKGVAVNVIAMIVVTLSIASVLGAAPTVPRSSPLTPKSPLPTSPPPLSKYQRERLEKYRSSAPADQYFGKMKMSYLGINNTFRDATIMSGDHTADPTIVNRVAFADNALRDWANRFPHDPQLARSYFLAVVAQRKIWLKPNQEKAWIYMKRLVSLFPTSFFGKQMKRNMAIGFTEHYYADAQVCVTPTPTPTATPMPAATEPPAPRRGRPRATPTPEPTATPTPEPTATPSPTPVSTPQVLSTGLKVQIETPPCIPPPTPTPSRTETPTPSPALPSASPGIPAVPVSPTAVASPTTTAAPTTTASPTALPAATLPPFASPLPSRSPRPS